jgi:hypothetical protein
MRSSAADRGVIGFDGERSSAGAARRDRNATLAIAPSDTNADAS